MEYKPKVITGKVTGTGWPIDGHVLWFSQWDYDNRENWHLYGWEDSEDEVVMQTVFKTETEAGLCLFDTLEKFAENWKAKKWEPQGSFCLPLDKVEVLEVKQEESTNNTREQLRAHGFDLAPRKQTDRSGILCLPLDKNLNGDVQASTRTGSPSSARHAAGNAGNTRKPTDSPKNRARKCSVLSARSRLGSCHRSERKAQTARSEGGQSVKEENNTEGLYTLKIDARHYFPDGKTTWGVLEALRCRKYAEVLAFYLECDLDDIEKQAHRLAESTSLSYSEALHKIGGDMLRSKEEKPAPLSLWPIRREPVRPNRAARRAAKRKGGRNGR